MLKKVDLREKLSDAIFELLKENKDINKISVRLICEKAQTSRMSYYRLFGSKEELVNYKLDKTFYRFFDKFIQKDSQTVDSFLDSFLIVCREEQNYLKILVSSGLEIKIYEKLSFYLEDLVEKRILRVRRKISKTWTVFVSGGLYHLVLDWLDDNLEQSNEDLIVSTRRFFR